MKSPSGKPRAQAQRPVAKKAVQLNLRRTPVWPEEDELNERPDGNFWKWFGIVFLIHVIAFIVLILLFHHRTKPPPEFIQLQPPGQTVHGNPGPDTAPKVAPTTPTPSAQAATPAPPTPRTPPKPKVQQAQPKPTPKPPPLIKDQAPTAITPPVVKPKPKPVKPKVKVDLTLVEDPTDDSTPAPTKTKPVTHPKKPAPKTPAHADISQDTPGLSKAEVAAKLGDEFKNSGTEKSDQTGPNGDAKGKATDFSDYKRLIHDCVMNKWNIPSVSDPTAIEPLVNIHIEKNGYVPPSSVSLARSSGNPAIDQSALEAARSIGKLPQSLPEGFPSDTSINFQLQN